MTLYVVLFVVLSLFIIWLACKGHVCWITRKSYQPAHARMSETMRVWRYQLACDGPDPWIHPVDTTKHTPYALFNLLIEDNKPVTFPVSIHTFPVKRAATAGLALILCVVAAMLVCAL
jgi:hypothetical protein